MKYECNKEPKFICQFCGKRIYYPSNYKKHLILKHYYKMNSNAVDSNMVGSDEIVALTRI